MHRWCSSHRQLHDCLAHGVAEVVQLLPAQSPIEGGADVSAGQPKFDIVDLVDHRILGAFQSGIDEKDQKETHFDHYENNADRAKDNLSWRDTRKFLREIQDFDGRIQRQDSTLAPLRPLFGLHGRNLR